MPKQEETPVHWTDEELAAIRAGAGITLNARKERVNTLTHPQNEPDSHELRIDRHGKRT